MAGDLVVVSGPGPIGTLCAMLARTQGARVVMLGTSVDSLRMDLSLRLRMDRIINVDKENTSQIVNDLTDGYGADAVIECSGAEASANMCLDLVKRRGQYTQVGIFGKPLHLDLDRLLYKELHIQGSICRTWQTWQRIIGILEQGAIDLHPLISEKLPLSRWAEAFDRVRSKQGTKSCSIPINDNSSAAQAGKNLDTR